jgi:hypothetical protein
MIKKKDLSGQETIRTLECLIQDIRDGKDLAAIVMVTSKDSEEVVADLYCHNYNMFAFVTPLLEIVQDIYRHTVDLLYQDGVRH